jgi:uncharacterized membrane-anchored protein
MAMNEHPLRLVLNHELHARPPLPVDGPCWISHLAMLHDGNLRNQEEASLHNLCALLDNDFCPLVEGDHWVLEITLPSCAVLRLKWEYHNEFSSYTFFLDRLQHDPASTTALDALPQVWLSALPGSVIAATHIEFNQCRDQDPFAALLSNISEQNNDMVCSRVANGAAWVLSDFRLHDGFSKFVVIDQSLRRSQAGRTIQRLVEIDTYGMLALLTFPIAKGVNRLLASVDENLQTLMRDITAERNAKDERRLLGRLTKLAAEVEESVSRTAFRFGAAAAYYRLVQQRIHDLRELRIDGFQPISEFIDRRLAPAINTCNSVAARQQDLASRIARKSALLRTRVDIELEQQNLELLAQMNRRAQLQLRLQETVEGLSVVVLTYYGSQLVQYLAKGTKDFHHQSTDVITAISIPIVAGLVFWGLQKTRKKLFDIEE